MFSKKIEINGGIILVEKRESIAQTTIHMMFMRYDIAVIWLSKDKVVVDKTVARKWVPYYAPKEPAQYVLELHPSKLDSFFIGDQIEIALIE